MDKKIQDRLKEKEGRQHYSGPHRIARNILKIVLLLQTDERYNRQDLARIFDVNKRTISRYLQVLRDLGYKITYDHKTDSYNLENDQNLI